MKVTGTIFTTGPDEYEVVVQTENPSRHNPKGQVFRQTARSFHQPPNVILARMFRNLADSLENEWERRAEAPEIEKLENPQDLTINE